MYFNILLPIPILYKTLIHSVLKNVKRITIYHIRNCILMYVLGALESNSLHSRRSVTVLESPRDSQLHPLFLPVVAGRQRLRTLIYKPTSFSTSLLYTKVFLAMSQKKSGGALSILCVHCNCFIV